MENPSLASAGPANAPPPGAVEAFARDLLSLIRNVRVYPSGHPFLADRCERLLTGAEQDLPTPLDVGITNEELVVGGRFFGGDGSRARQLAGLLHSRNLLRLVWSPGVITADAEHLAAVLSRDELRAGQVCDALHDLGVHTIVLEPLALERIHGAFRAGTSVPEGGEPDGGDRAHQAWQWLLHEDTTPEQLASALDGDGAWNPEGMDPSDAAALAGVLVRTEQKLERALGGLAGDRREQVLERLVEVGRRVPVSALAATLSAADAGGGGLHGPAVTALEQSIDEDRLVDLLAVLVTDQGKNTRRLVDVYRRFAPSGGAQELLPVVKARMASTRGSPFSGEVWETLEQFLFSLDEDPFMDQDYAQALERLAAEAGGPKEDDGDLTQDLQDHLDRVALALACDDPCGISRPVLLHRLEQRSGKLGPLHGVRLLAAVNEVLPELLDQHPTLAEDALGRVCRRLREVDPEGRMETVCFARSREGTLLEFLLRRLLDEGRIAVRRFLVDVLAGLGPATTPTIVSRMRSGPWFLTRNLALALGGRGDPAAVPALRALLDHEHRKVRGAGLTALGSIGTEGAVAVLEAFASDPARPESERAAARRAQGGGSGDTEGDES